MIKHSPCKRCDGRGFIKSTFNYICPDCNGSGFYLAQMTNADRIRAMTDEELAKTIAGADWCEYCDQVRQDGTCHAMELGGPLNRYCIAGCLKWLQKPAEEDDHA